MIAILRFDGGQNGASGRAAGFAVIAAAVLIAQLPGPTVMGRVEVAVPLNKVVGLLSTGDGRGLGDEAALADFFAVLAWTGQG